MNQVVEAKVEPDLATARAEAAAALAAGEAARARILIDQALQRWPKDFTLRMQQAEALQELGAPENAIEAYLRLGRELGGNPWPLLRAVRLLRETGKLEQAREVFADAIWSGAAPDDAKLRALAWLVTAADEGEPAAAFLERLAAASSPALSPEALGRLAELRARQGRQADARTALARIGGAAPARARAVEADLLLAEGRTSDLVPLAASIAAEQPDQVEHVRRLVGALAIAGDTARAIETLIAALERWPGDWILLGRLNVFALPRERLETLVTRVAGHAGSPKMPEISRFQLAVNLLNLGRTAEALDLLRGIAEHGPTGAMSAPLLRVLDMAPPEWWRSRSRLDDDRAAEVQIVRSPGARTALLVFGGLTRGHSHLPLGYFDALLADVPAHVVYLRDGTGRGFLKGIERFGGTDAGAAVGLREILADLGAERVVGLGSSIAGHAAARFGALIGMDAVALLSAPTSLDGGMIAGERNSPYNRLHLLRRYAKMMSEGSSGVDLVELFAANPRMRGFYYHGEGTERGERNATRLKGLSNVELRPVAGTPHASLPLDIIPTPLWRRLLTEDLGLGG